MENSNTQTSKKKFALYCRVSTTDQKLGMESQARALREYCRMYNITNYEFFADEGISGTKASRPALDRLMGLVKAGEIDSVIVYSFSRFARSVSHLLQGLEEMKIANCNFISLSEKLDLNSSLGRAVFVFIGAIAQLERDLISERVKNGLANARAKGKLLGRTKKRDSTLIRKLLHAGMSFRQIATVANCSHGSVSAEKKSMQKDFEERIRQESLATQEEQTIQHEQAQIPNIDELMQSSSQKTTT